MCVIRNHEIDHNISSYLKRYDAKGSISFQLQPNEYENLAKLTKWYKEEYLVRKPSENTKDALTKSGLATDSKAVFVFGFLSQHWNKGSHISAEKSEGFIVVTVRKVVRH